MPNQKVKEIQKVYDGFYQAIIDYLLKNFGKLGGRLIANVVSEIAQKHPEINLDLESAKKKPQKLPKYTLPENITVAEKVKLGNDILNIVNSNFRKVMGPAGEGILRNAVSKVYDKNEEKIKNLGIKLPEWFLKQMKKRSLIGQRMAEAFKEF